jgi:electron transfer flavoprotein alpha subunit
MTTPTTASLRIAALVKQIPAFESMTLGDDGRLVRDGLALEMSAYCRRAVAEGVALAGATGGSCTIVTLGPPSAEDVLREAIAWGADDGVLVTDPAFAGSDTLATARALAAALTRIELDGRGPFDLVLVGRNSVDADTGQVPPGLAQLLDLPFATGVRQLELGAGEVRVVCEHDDEWVTKDVALPAVLSTAERLCDPCKRPPDARAAVPADRITVLSAADLGPGPWGQAGSPTWVGEVRVLPVERQRKRLEGPVETQVAEAVALLSARGVFDHVPDPSAGRAVPPAATSTDRVIGVVVEPDRPRSARELLGAAADLAGQVAGRVAALAVADDGRVELSTWGADELVHLAGGARIDGAVEEDVAAAVAAWAADIGPWAVLVPGTPWGREVASRAAAALGAGLTGDAVELDVVDDRLVCWKPAFGGRTVAAIHATSPVQMATVRPGVLPVRPPRPADDLPVTVVPVAPRGRVTVVTAIREDDSGLMMVAPRIIGIGQGVDPTRYGELEELRAVLGAEYAATRKVTDAGHLPRARQIGITGHAVAPRLFVSLGSSGKFNHTVGIRQAGTILAINPDPEALIWDWCDVGITATWEEAVPLLTAALRPLVDRT